MSSAWEYTRSGGHCAYAREAIDKEGPANLLRRARRAVSIEGSDLGYSRSSPASLSVVLSHPLNSGLCSNVYASEGLYHRTTRTVTSYDALRANSLISPQLAQPHHRTGTSHHRTKRSTKNPTLNARLRLSSPHTRSRFTTTLAQQTSAALLRFVSRRPPRSSPP